MERAERKRMKGGGGCLKAERIVERDGWVEEQRWLRLEWRAADSGGWIGRGNKSGEQRDGDEEKDNKVQGSVGAQIKDEQKVGSRTVELTKTRKQSRWRKKDTDRTRRGLWADGWNWSEWRNDMRVEKLRIPTYGLVSAEICSQTKFSKTDSTQQLPNNLEENTVKRMLGNMLIWFLAANHVCVLNMTLQEPISLA